MATKFIENWVNLNFSPNWLCVEKLRSIAPILRKKHLQGVGDTLIETMLQRISDMPPLALPAFLNQVLLSALVCLWATNVGGELPRIGKHRASYSQTLFESRFDSQMVASEIEFVSEVRSFLTFLTFPSFPG